MFKPFALAFLLVVGWQIGAAPLPLELPGDRLLAQYFSNEVWTIADETQEKLRALGCSYELRGKMREQLKEMLGLPTSLADSPLFACVTGTNLEEEFVVEKLHFQPVPRVYYTANLYIPRQGRKPFPAVLYLCGHWSCVSNGVSYGNKVRYQKDGITFAKNGYVCLVLDTVQWGEIPTEHRGTTRQGAWWWNAVGFTPAGIEAWAGLRAIDYLCTRSEVDTNRIGVTGHSGGGAYTWMVSALDERVKAAAPMAGIADLQTHILRGLIDSHCDCNFPINTYRWDFTVMPALICPRPLLIGGTDADPIFPLETTLRFFQAAETVYRTVGVSTNLSLIITPGPHDETPEMRLAVVRWFDRHLKGLSRSEGVLQREELFAPEQLKVFEDLPSDAQNSEVARVFVSGKKHPKPRDIEELRAVLSSRVFTGWPKIMEVSEIRVRSWTNEVRRVVLVELQFYSQPFVPLRVYVLFPEARKDEGRLTVVPLLQEEWIGFVRHVRSLFPEVEIEGVGPSSSVESVPFDTFADEAAAFVAVRGVGPTRWTDDEKTLGRIRRRFMALGQTLDGMRVWDILCALRALRIALPGIAREMDMRGRGTMGVNALYAAVFEHNIRVVRLISPPESHMVGPDYLNVLHYVDIGEVVELLTRAGVKVEFVR